jgi:hypothetical protein
MPYASLSYRMLSVNSNASFTSLCVTNSRAVETNTSFRLRGISRFLGARMTWEPHDERRAIPLG